MKCDPYCERFFLVISLAWFGVELTIRDPINCGEGCKCFTFQKRSLRLFSITPCIWQTQFHKNKFALLIGIFWRKLLLKTRNAFTFCPLFKILVLRTVWLWCARNCHILWGAGPLLSECPSTHRGRGSTAISEGFTLACLNDLTAGFFFFEEWHLKKSSKQTIVAASKNLWTLVWQGGGGVSALKSLGRSIPKFPFFSLFVCLFVNDKRGMFEAGLLTVCLMGQMAPGLKG